MSVGCAIVASRTPPVEEVLAHGRTGLLVDFFDRDALVESGCALLEDRGLAARLGAAARAKLADAHDLRTCCLPAQIAWVQELARGLER